MAVTLPLFINAVDYNAETERRGFSGLLAQSAPGVARSGVLGPAPSVSLSGSTVQVGPFNAAISSAKGAYLLAVDSVTSAGTVGVADATNGRLDRIVLEVLDPDNGSGGTSRLGRLRVVAGTAAALPGLPPLPALALHVGQVQVPKSGGGNAVVTVDCQFTAAAGAPVPVRNEVDRATLAQYDGVQALRLDLPGRNIDVFAGTSWLAGATSKGLIPLVTANYQPDPPRADGLAQEAPSYYRAGTRVHLSGVASNKIPITFTGDVEYILGYLPEKFRPRYPEYFTIEVAFTNCRLWVRPDGEIRFKFPGPIPSLAAPLGKFSLSGISFDAA